MMCCHGPSKKKVTSGYFLQICSMGQWGCYLANHQEYILLIYISILLYTKILEVNLFASACTLFHRGFSPINGAYLPLVIPEYI